MPGHSLPWCNRHQFSKDYILLSFVTDCDDPSLPVASSSLDNNYRLTERVRARMMAYEQELGHELPVMKQAAINASYKAVAYGREAGQEIKVEFYKVDRFFASAADMMRSDGLPYWNGL